MSTEKKPGGGARATAKVVRGEDWAITSEATLGVEGPGQAVIEDGPAQGCRFWDVRLPEFLRVVHVPGRKVYAHGREFDCLDKLDDTIRKGEVIEVYRQRTWAHYRGGGFVGVYVWLPLDEGTRATVADNRAWRDVVVPELAELPPVPRGEPPLPAFACRR